MIQRRVRRGARTTVTAVVEETPAPQEVVKPIDKQAAKAPPAKPERAQAARQRDPSSSSRVDYDGVILRYKERANTPKKAIRAMCIECMGGLIAEVDRCTSKTCALYPFRKGENPFHKLSKHNRTD